MLRSPCRICGTIDFPKYQRRRTINGIKVVIMSRYCTKCESDKDKDRYYRNHEKTLEYQRLRRKLNPESHKISRLKWLEKNRLKWNEYSRKYKKRRNDERAEKVSRLAGDVAGRTGRDVRETPTNTFNCGDTCG